MDYQFLKKLFNRSIIDDNNCFLWTRACVGISKTGKGGHGLVWYEKKLHYVHRVSAHIYFKFDLESELQVNHKNICNNRNCWNPNHLYIGNQAANLEDALTKNTWQPGRHNKEKAHCIRGHEFTLLNTHIDRRGHRQCIECNQNRKFKGVVWK